MYPERLRLHTHSSYACTVEGLTVSIAARRAQIPLFIAPAPFGSASILIHLSGEEQRPLTGRFTLSSFAAAPITARFVNRRPGGASPLALWPAVRGTVTDERREDADPMSGAAELMAAGGRLSPRRRPRAPRGLRDAVASAMKRLV